jgi:hypothetical protein
MNSKTTGPLLIKFISIDSPRLEEDLLLIFSTHYIYRSYEFFFSSRKLIIFLIQLGLLMLLLRYNKTDIIFYIIFYHLDYYEFKIEIDTMEIRHTPNYTLLRVYNL